jgi:hypothetical protein
MPYEHDVFLSYRRHGEWPPWVRSIFGPMFRHWLGEELPGVRIFIDEDSGAHSELPKLLCRSFLRSISAVHGASSN